MATCADFNDDDCVEELSNAMHQMKLDKGKSY